MRMITLAGMAGAILFTIGCGGSKATESCQRMLDCDAALATDVESYSAAFDGSVYGDGGSCYKGDRDACDAACESALTGYQSSAQAYVTAGELSAVPDPCE